MDVPQFTQYDFPNLRDKLRCRKRIALGKPGLTGQGVWKSPRYHLPELPRYHLVGTVPVIPQGATP